MPEHEPKPVSRLPNSRYTDFMSTPCLAYLRRERRIALWAFAAAVVTLLPSLLAAQPSDLRTSSDRPNLQGVWTNASLTRLSRPRNIETLVLSPEEADRLADGHFHNVRARNEFTKSDPNRDAPEVVESLPPVGNYNASWVDPGSTYAVVKGEIRSSWIVDPPDGRVPYREHIIEGRRGRGELRRFPSDPEIFSLGERCLLGFGNTGGPPMLNVLYNNFYRFVQTDDHLLIVVEMVHDARIVRIDSKHGPDADRRWLGDSIGHWDGDTLVIETTNFHPARSSGSVPLSADGLVTERLTRTSQDELLYEFTVDDDANYERSFRGEMSFRAVDDRLYEYACHEGNYAMGTMLRGARLLEQEATRP